LKISTSWWRGTSGNRSAQFSSGNWLKKLLWKLENWPAWNSQENSHFHPWMLDNRNRYLLLVFLWDLWKCNLFSCKNDECEKAHLSHYFINSEIIIALLSIIINKCFCFVYESILYRNFKDKQAYI
jgi:hypothetical protein